MNEQVEVQASAVINKLLTRIGELELRVATLTAKIEAITAEDTEAEVIE